MSELIELSYVRSKSKKEVNHLYVGISKKLDPNNEEQLLIIFVEPYSLFNSKSTKAFQFSDLFSFIDIVRMYIDKDILEQYTYDDEKQEHHVRLIIRKEAIDKALSDEKGKKAIQLLAKQEHHVCFTYESWDLLQEANNSLKKQEAVSS